MTRAYLSSWSPRKAAVAGATGLAMVGASLVGAAPLIAPAVAAGGSAVESLGPIAVVPGSGQVAPTLPVSVVRGGVALSQRPIMIFAGDTATANEVEVVDVSLGRSKWAWVGQVRSGRTTIGKDLLAGHAYIWRWRVSGGEWKSGGSFVARFGTSNGQGAVSVGAASVSTLTGEIGVGWSSGVVAGPAMSVGAQLSWRSGATAVEGDVSVPGVPSGWTLSASTGSSWMGLTESRDAVVRGVAPAAPRAVLTAGTLNVAWRYPVGAARSFEVEAKDTRGRWVTTARLAASATSETYEVTVAPPAQVGLGAKIRVVARVGKGDLTTRYVLTSGVDLYSGVGRVVDRAVRGVLAPAAPVDGSGSGGLVVSGDAPRSVSVWGWSGSTLTFVRNASGVYEQVLTSDSDVQGARNSIDRRLVDGEWVWALTDTSGVVTEFVDGHAVRVTGDGTPVSTSKWAADRLVEVRPSGVAADAPRALGFVYAGSGDCPSDAWAAYGFVAAPDGMLCRVTYGNGIATEIGYVDGVNGGVQIGLIKDVGNEAMTLGWDSVGHLVATRAGLVSRSALADPRLKALTTNIDYDDSGRAAVLREAAPALGADRIIQRITFPSVGETAVINATKVTAKVDASVGSAQWSKTIEFNPANQAVTGGQDRAGMRMTVQTDASGRPQKVIDPERRITTFTYDKTGIQVGQSGPFTNDSSRGLVTKATYDADVADSKTDTWLGMQAHIYTRVNFAGETSGGWWGKDDRSGLGYSWRELPAGADSKWSARATAKWTPTSESRDWSFRIDGSGANISLLIEGELCSTDNAGRCDITGLPAGAKSVVVQLDDATARGGFRILAAPLGSDPVLVPATQVEPMFGLVTSQRVNDTFPGSERDPQTVREYSKPWAQEVASVTMPGGLTTMHALEPMDPANSEWGRPLVRTTPGGKTISYSYYANEAVAAPPALCGGGVAVPQYGGLRTVTRQDGTSEERIFDVYGQIISLITRGEQGAVQTACVKFDEAGALVSRRIFNASDELVEATVVKGDIDGKPWLSSTTITHGPGSPVTPGASITTTSQIDMAGRVVRFVDGFGTVTTSTFTGQGKPRVVTVTSPASTGSRVLRLEFTYTETQNWLDTVKINGTQAAKVNYDTTLGRIDSILYANGVSVSYEYFGNGQANKMTVVSGADRVVNQLQVKGTGRTMGSSVTATGSSDYTEGRDYSYDEAGRLIEATIASTQAGMPASTAFTYSYGAQAARCGSGYTGAGKDSLRTGGSRNGVAFTTCHDADGLTTSTTDPLLTGGSGTAALRHDKFGRVTRIAGASDIALTWGADSQLAVLTDGDTQTVMNTFSGLMHTKTVTRGAGAASTVGYGYSSPDAPTFTYGMTGNTPTSVVSTLVGLPGGAQLTIPTSSLAVMTLSDIEGAALITVGLPSLGAGAANTDVAPAVGASPRFGPYGEALVTPTYSSAVPHYTWQNAAGLETLAGDSSITLMGVRPYLPALGEFLAKDPDVSAGNNLYSFTSGDVVNAADWSGGSETCGFLCWGLAGGGAIMALFGPAGALIGAGMASAAVALSVRAAKANGEAPLSSMEVVFSSAALVFAGGKLVQSAIGTFKIWRFAKNKAKAQKGSAMKSAGEESGEGLIGGGKRDVNTQDLNDLLAGKSSRLSDKSAAQSYEHVKSQNASVLGPKNGQRLTGNGGQNMDNIYEAAGSPIKDNGSLFRRTTNKKSMDIEIQSSHDSGFHGNPNDLHYFIMNQLTKL